MSKSFKVAFIGTGWVGDHQMKHLSKLDGIECVAAADVSEGSLQKFKSAWNPKYTFNDYRRMLAEVKELDAVSVCTPNGLHAENAIAALQAGFHVLVEKPMAMNAREAQRIMDAAKASGKQLVIGFQHRFEYEENEEVAEGHVIRTEPPAGERVAQDTVVTIIVSGGPGTVFVPADVINTPVGSA